MKKAEAHMGIGLDSRMIVTPSKNENPGRNGRRGFQMQKTGLPSLSANPVT